MARCTPARAVRDPMHAGTPSTRKPGGPWIAWRGRARPQRQGYGRNPLMHGPGKSDPPIVPGKRPNKPGRPGAEAVEGRGGAKGTAGRQSTGRNSSRETVSQALACVREAAKRNRNERFTALMHHVTPELLAWAFHQLKAEGGSRRRRGDVGGVRGRARWQHRRPAPPRDAAAATGRSRRGGSTSRRPTAGNGRSASRHSRTRSSSGRWWRC